MDCRICGFWHTEDEPCPDPVAKAITDAARRTRQQSAALNSAATLIGNIAEETREARHRFKPDDPERLRLLTLETRLLMALVDLRKAGATLPEAIIRQLDWGKGQAP